MTSDALHDLTDYERRIIANVRDHGCHVTSVALAADEAWEPPFSYSTGFIETVDQPEVIVLGLGGELCHSMINILLDKCRQGLVLSDGAVIEGVLAGHRVIARAVVSDRITREHFNSAIWYEKRCSGRMLDRAVQIVWPGARDGLFPWDDGCSEKTRDLQPALYERSMNS